MDHGQRNRHTSIRRRLDCGSIKRYEKLWPCLLLILCQQTLLSSCLGCDWVLGQSISTTHLLHSESSLRYDALSQGRRIFNTCVKIFTLSPVILRLVAALRQSVGTSMSGLPGEFGQRTDSDAGRPTTQTTPTTCQRIKYLSLSSTPPRTTFGTREMLAPRTMAFHLGQCCHSNSFTLKDALSSGRQLNISGIPSFTCLGPRLYPRYFYHLSLFYSLINRTQLTPITPSYWSSISLCLFFLIALYPKTRDVSHSFAFASAFLC